MNYRQSLESTRRRSWLYVILLASVAATTAAAQDAVPAKPPVIVINRGYRLLISSDKGTIASFRSTFGIDHELLIPDHAACRSSRSSS